MCHAARLARLLFGDRSRSRETISDVTENCERARDKQYTSMPQGMGGTSSVHAALRSECAIFRERLGGRSHPIPYDEHASLPTLPFVQYFAWTSTIVNNESAPPERNHWE
jgi:hypothetical protein